jgi:hypothetical protein
MLISMARMVAVAATAALAAGGLVGDAQAAANYAPNPGFEDACGGATACQWPHWSGIAERDTAILHSGSASYRIQPVDNTTRLDMLADPCIDVSFTPADATVSFWYRINSPIVTRVFVFLETSGGPGCTGFSGGIEVAYAFPSSDGAWHQVSDQVSTFWQSFRLKVGLACDSGCTGGAAANFDDLVVTQNPPTAVEVTSLHAISTRRGVALHWQAAAGVRLAGFNLYRREGSRLARLNPSLIHARPETSNRRSYAWIDQHQRRPVSSYQLQLVRLDGNTAWAGFASTR